MGIVLVPMVPADVPTLTLIMTRAFDDDTRRHTARPAGGPPGYDDGTFLNKYGLSSESDAYTIRDGDTVIGAVIVFPIDRQTYFLGNVFIDPPYQDSGVGMKVWNRIESTYPGAITWKTETQGFSKRNHHFYVNKCGFHIVKITRSDDRDLESYHMIKTRTPS